MTNGGAQERRQRNNARSRQLKFLRYRWSRGTRTLLVLVLGSCGNRGADTEDLTVDIGETAISVGGQPLLSIGREGDPRYEFTEIVGAGQLSSGEWVILDRGSRQLRVYSTSGEHVRNVGGAGEGPGEFRDVHHMSVGSDDKVYVYDQMLRRVTVVDVRGRVTDTHEVTPNGVGTVPSAVDFLGDQAIIVQTHLVSPCRPGIVSEDTTVFYAVPLFQGGAPARVIARERGMQRWGSTLNVLERCMGQVVPYAPGPIAAVGHSALYVAGRGERSLKRYSLPGGEVQTIPIGAARRAISRETIEQHIKGQIASTPRDELGRELPRDQGMQLYERRLRELPYPDSLPLLDQVLIDGLGLVWMLQYTLPSDSLSIWMVVRQDGSTVSRVQLPGQFRVLDVGTDYVVGQVRDDFDVQRLVIYPISRN